MKKSAITVFILFVISIFPCSIFSHTLDGSEKSTLDVIKVYKEESVSFHGRVTQMGEKLQKRGLNLKEFCDDVLSDVQYTHYWEKALLFLATHYREDYVQLGRETIAFVLRDESVMNKDVLDAKVIALSNLSGIINPNSYEKMPGMKEFIDKDMGVFLGLGNWVDPKFWEEFFVQKGPLIGIEKESKEFHECCVQAACMCLLSSKYINRLTNDKKYLDCVEWCKDCPDQAGMYRALSSPRMVKKMDENEFDIFAYQKQSQNPTRKVEDSEEIRKRSARIRQMIQNMHKDQ